MHVARPGAHVCAAVGGGAEGRVGGEMAKASSFLRVAPLSTL